MIQYLIEVSIFWGISALLYHAFLRKELYFSLGRTWLLVTLGLGLMVPFLLPYLPGVGLVSPIDGGVLPELRIQSGTETEAGASAFTWTSVSVLFGVYLIGFAVSLIRVAIGLQRLYKLMKTGAGERLEDGCVLLRHRKVKFPFSFFNRIFVPENYEVEEGPNAAILSHERAHAHGWHSVDVLLLELLCAIFWFHPLAHWYRKTIKNVHEYLADSVATETLGKKNYGLLLMGRSLPAVQPALVHHFFQSPLKKRLWMLTRTRKSPLNLAKYAFVLPLFLMAGWVLTPANSNKTAAEPEYIMPEYPGGIPALMEFLTNNTNYPKEAQNTGIEGVAQVQIIIDEQGNVAEAKVLNEDLDPILKKEALRVVMQLPQWKPAMADGQNIKGQMTLPIRFQLE